MPQKRSKKREPSEQSEMPEAIELESASRPVQGVSGLYRLGTGRSRSITGEPSTAEDAIALAEPGDRAFADEAPGEAAGFLPWWRTTEELRLDVDGPYPQTTASGTITTPFRRATHWIAELRRWGTNRWIGRIWYKDGDTSTFPYTRVYIRTTPPWSTARNLVAIFYGGGARPRSRTMRWISPYFQSVEFEYDSVVGVSAVTEIGTHDHPNRPPGMPNENLAIAEVYRRAGFDVSTRAGSVPLTGAGTNARWSDAEMHDAMQLYWSRFGNRAQWSMWVFFAALHESGVGLGGIMFDDIGPNHRQGTAIFNDSFISSPPIGDAAPDAWVRRMRFWTACHEMGHAFNLAHSWQKSLGSAWIPLADEPEARSFMNYPYNVSGGQTAFFADFDYRFSDPELLFMRHAPSRFVQMGNADWFDDHGFRNADVSPEPKLRLQVRVNRDRSVYEFLEPIVVELKLTNIGHDPLVLDADILSDDHLTVIVKRAGRPARRHLPYARYCAKPAKTVLAAGESLYESHFTSVGLGGWQIDEPGDYVIQVALRVEEEDVVSNPLQLRVLTPLERQEERLAQDYFSDGVGRVLAMDGSLYLGAANDVLRDVADRLGGTPVAAHARIALAGPAMRDYKQINLDRGADTPRSIGTEGGKIEKRASQLKEAKTFLAPALTEQMDVSAATLGHIDHKWYVDQYTDFLAAHDRTDEAVKIQDGLLKIFKSRGVKATVLDEVKATRDDYKLMKTEPKKAGDRLLARRTSAGQRMPEASLKEH